MRQISSHLDSDGIHIEYRGNFFNHGFTQKHSIRPSRPTNRCLGRDVCLAHGRRNVPVWNIVAIAECCDTSSQGAIITIKKSARLLIDLDLNGIDNLKIAFLKKKKKKFFFKIAILTTTVLCSNLVNCLVLIALSYHVILELNSHGHFDRFVQPSRCKTDSGG